MPYIRCWKCGQAVDVPPELYPESYTGEIPLSEPYYCDACESKMPTIVDPWGTDQGGDDDMRFCTKHLCPMNLVDYDDGSRYECPVCSQEDGEALGRV